jgi:hypothetical protein
MSRFTPGFVPILYLFTPESQLFSLFSRPSLPEEHIELRLFFPTDAFFLSNPCVIIMNCMLIDAKECGRLRGIFPHFSNRDNNRFIRREGARIKPEFENPVLKFAAAIGVHFIPLSKIEHGKRSKAKLKAS